MKHGEGRLQRPDGSIYTGTWEGNVIRGSGKVSIQVGRGPYGGPSQVRQRLASDADKTLSDLIDSHPPPCPLPPPFTTTLKHILDS